MVYGVKIDAKKVI